jgi:hypothetical protein
MPYINPSHRTLVDSLIDDLSSTIQSASPQDRVGMANYVISRLLLKGIVGTPEDLKYVKINDVYGVIEGVKAEFARSISGPYEAQKEFDNGPINW